MKTKGILLALITSVLGAVITLFVYVSYFQPKIERAEAPAGEKVIYTGLNESLPVETMDFTDAAEKAVHAVVHVKTKSQANYNYNPFYEFFFGEKPNVQPQPVMGFGSGVIISSDGYIVTNNHVVDGSSDIEVVLNDRRSFPAEVIGVDPSTDIALLKIDASDLPFMVYGNSDDLKLGQWVLAVGNPYNLTSTVTAGIVSAKARNINILGESSIESFIQTDAAVNPGNSGGALVNTKGELVGINTAIASRTGSYSGNSFAVPVNIAKKVVGDLKEYGQVQRAILGVTIQDVTQEVAKEHKIESLNGVYVNGIREGGAALNAGIKEGDVIMSVNNVLVNSVSELQEQISKYRPNDKVNILVNRNNKEKDFEVVLRNMDGDTGIVKKDNTLSILGASLEPLNNEQKKELGVKYGVRVASLKSGKLMKAGVREGFVITQINNKPVNTVEDIRAILSKTDGGVYIEGIYPDRTIAYYAFGM
ncbi:MAG: Do family serine endopeptidase [Bacteroidales bacterium]|nr:Do family serine endopeptidase [Bacteroidales bacterium]MCB8999096.1 Do family serine endopeptidase [Bacteroidales bacterium]